MRATSAIVVAVILVAAACRGGGSGTSTGGGGGIPPVVAALGKDAEVSPFAGWTVQGVSLYQINVTASDLSSTTIVGVDDKTGALVRGPELMRRIGALPADQLAQRAFGVVIGDGEVPLSPGDPRPSMVSEQEWSTLAAPAIADGALVLFALRGEMHPVLYEYRISLDTFAVTLRPAVDVLVANGQTVALGAAWCEPLRRCECWAGCARFQAVRVPGRPVDQALWHLVGSDPAEAFVRGERCTTARCAQICRADAPTATCDPALRPEQGESCDKSCQPSEAPYRCETHPDRCDRVDHPGRAKAAAASR